MNKKIWILKAILPGLLFAVIATAKSAPRLPEELLGNWLKTDGSNQFVIGLYPEVACYRNNTWIITSVAGGEGHWQLKLQNDSASRSLDLLQKDAHTIVLSENGQQYTLKNIRTYNYQYKPQQHAFKQPLFTQANVTLKGYIHWPGAKRTQKNNYIQVSYKNAFTGEAEYFYAPLDSQRRFSISFPVYKFQRCTLSQGSLELADFFVQPGNTLLITVNKTVKVKEQNPDYSMLMQKVSVMGDDEDFNNLYQHFLCRNNDQDLPAFPEAVKPKGLSEKESQVAFYSDFYLKQQKAIEQVYTPARAEQRFIDFIKNELRYACADGLLSNVKGRYGDNREHMLDSSYMTYAYQAYLAGATPDAFLHDSYYRVAARYGEKLEEARFGNTRNYRFSPEKMDERIRKEYGPLLSREFMQVYDTIHRDFAKVQNMPEEAIIRQYFHGSKEKAQAFKYVFGKITDQLFMEAADSTSYTVYKQEISDPFLRFAASLQRLLHPSSSDDDLGIPSTFRLKLFGSYCEIPGTPLHIVDTLNEAQALKLAGAGLQARFDGTLLKEVNNEADWQAELKRHRGKVVVIWAFAHYFEKKHAQRSLYELKQMEELYRGKNVVFLKCIQQRQRSDKVKQLLGYLRLMENNDALNNILYMDRSVSAMTLLSDGIDNRSNIYDTAGQAHHPGFFYTSRFQRSDDLSLESELDAVLAGKVREYESTADKIFSANMRGNRYSSYDKPVNTWTLYKTAGPYLVFASKEPEKPDYETGDSVFNQVSFYGDTIYREHQLALRKRRLPVDKNTIFYSYQYRKEFIPGDFGGPYQYNRDKRLLSIYDNKRKLHKQFRVVTITTDIMVLELLQE